MFLAYCPTSPFQDCEKLGNWASINVESIDLCSVVFFLTLKMCFKPSKISQKPASEVCTYKRQYEHLSETCVIDGEMQTFVSAFMFILHPGRTKNSSQSFRPIS